MPSADQNNEVTFASSPYDSKTDIQPAAISDISRCYNNNASVSSPQDSNAIMVDPESEDRADEPQGRFRILAIMTALSVS
jgi:hypothetical protein